MTQEQFKTTLERIAVCIDELAIVNSYNKSTEVTNALVDATRTIVNLSLAVTSDYITGISNELAESEIQDYNNSAEGKISHAAGKALADRLGG